MKGEEIDKIRGNLTLRFGYTEDYHSYIKETCIKLYPKGERRFEVRFLRKIYLAAKLKEAVYAADAWREGIRESTF